jgi:two-component system, NarL family, sensor kinase
VSADPALTTDLRSLFRDSEARAARLLIEVSRDLAGACPDRLEDVLSHAARRAAMFAGYADGMICEGAKTASEDVLVVPLDALAEKGRPGVSLVFSRPLNSGAISAPEDAETLRLLVEMIEARLTVDLQGRKEGELLGRLERRERELEQVLSKVVGAQEAERAAISADLHDGVAQQVAALHRRLELLRLDAEPETVQARELDSLIDGARRAVSDLRGIIAGLRPPSLDDLGAAAALREEARRLEGDGHAISVSDALPGRLPAWLETLLFRIGKEALNNVAKHAPGATVRLDLAQDVDGGFVALTVEDTGGLGSTDSSTGAAPRFGLDIMRERLAAVAGRLEVGHTAHGFRVRAVVPLTGA